jgi:hypothetical protein
MGFGWELALAEMRGEIVWSRADEMLIFCRLIGGLSSVGGNFEKIVLMHGDLFFSMY